MPLYSFGLWLAVMLVAASNGRSSLQLAKYIVGDVARPTSVTERPDASSPLIYASWRAGLVSRTSRPTAMCCVLYSLLRYVAAARPMRNTESTVRSIGWKVLFVGSTPAELALDC